MWCWKDGEYIVQSELTISPFDHGYLYGIGFFETFRTYDGVPFLLDEHLLRLQNALDHYHMTMPYSKDELVEVITELTKRSDNRDGYFRLNVSGGNEGLGLQAKIYANPTVILFRKELSETIAEKEAVWLETVRSTPEQSKRFKSHHYANNIQGRQEVESLKEIEGFFLNEAGYVAEGITSNIFWVKDGQLFTPAVSTGILNGITRQFVMKLAKELNLSVEEGEFLPSELQLAEECFITTSIQEIIPISKIGEVNYVGAKGKVYQDLHTQYKNYRGR
ncbi:MAG: aminodeoxychorismate lyase [Kurthia sp.]|nr:aminodeoxychorismate lyase [Candidatus Kurthia equi]